MVFMKLKNSITSESFWFGSKLLDCRSNEISADQSESLLFAENVHCFIVFVINHCVLVYHAAILQRFYSFATHRASTTRTFIAIMLPAEQKALTKFKHPGPQE